MAKMQTKSHVPGNIKKCAKLLMVKVLIDNVIANVE